MAGIEYRFGTIETFRELQSALRSAEQLPAAAPTNLRLKACNNDARRLDRYEISLEA